MKLNDPRRSFVEMIEKKNRYNNTNDGNTNNESSSELVTSEVYSPEDAINRAGFGNFQVELLFLCGFIWMARGFESVLNMFICSLITCQWNLLRWHSALIFTITTLFSVFGCFCYGMWADKFGRRTALCSSLIFVFLFGAVSAGLPSYTWFLVFRAVAAFVSGGFPQALTLICEYTPGPQRGRAVFILSCFYGGGVLLMLGVLYTAVQPTFHHWRLFCAVAAIPSGVAMGLMRFIPESFRFLLVNGKYFAAKAISEEVASANKRHLPSGTLYACAAEKKRRGGRMSRATVLLCFIGLATSVVYYSLDAITKQISRGDTVVDVRNSTSGDFLGDVFQVVNCLHNMTEEEFREITWTKALDFPSFFIFLLMVDVVDRKPLLCTSCVISSLFILLLFVPTQNLLMSNSCLFCAKTILVGQFDLLLLITAEAHPTTERGTAVGMQAAMAYLGCFISPYIVHCFLDLELVYLMGYCGISMLMSGIASVVLPWETRCQELM